MPVAADEDMVWWPYLLVDSDPGWRPFSITNRMAVAWISIIGLISCVVDMMTSKPTLCWCQCPVSEHIDSLRQLLLSFFQMANLLLLLASIVVEAPMLVAVYVWYVLAFVLLGLGVSLAQFLVRARAGGAGAAALGTAPEVAFLFVLFRCLPLVDKYGRDLRGTD